MKRHLLFILALAGITAAQGQTNIISTSPVAAQVMLGNYNPQTYMPSLVLGTKQVISQGLVDELSQDTLKAYIEKLATFRNRNTCADTISPVTGAGASRKWVYQKFQEYSAVHENRLIPSYLQFDHTIAGCTMNRFKNIFAVLPGADTTDKSVVLIEGHIDSRCEDNFDINCLAEGIEDNATGTALVMELARVMSKYSFKNTIVFMVTIGEEQGLIGASAFAQYCIDNKIQLEAVQNNDVIGGIYCGKTASPPTDCSNEGAVDSTHVRLFSYGIFTSPSKALARFTQLQYLEEAMSKEKVPMIVNIYAAEDRTGRGGDHIPFSNKSYRAIRFTAAHEHGNANSTAVGYTDRQHSYRDTLGLDKNNDGKVDSFYISFSYLRRNTLINGVSAAMAAIGPLVPTFTTISDSTGIHLQVTSQQQYNKFRVSVRRNGANYNLDQLYAFTGTTFTLPYVKKDSTYYISIASMDGNDIESIFTVEKNVKSLITNVVTSVPSTEKEIGMNAYPNPSWSLTTIRINAPSVQPGNVFVVVTDILGKEVARLPVFLNDGLAEVQFSHSHLPAGTYNYSLTRDNTILSSKRLLLVK